MSENRDRPQPMPVLDRVLAAISIVSLIVFVSVLIVYIAEVDLIVITLAVLAMAVADFYLLTRPRTPSTPSDR